MSTKTCKTCKQEKPLVDFSKDKAKKDGLRSVCRPCDSARATAWGERNPDRKRETVRKAQAAYRKRNPEKVKEGNQKFREDNPEYEREWRKNNRQKSREYSRKHYQKYGPEKSLERNRRRRARVLSNGFAPYTEQEVLDRYGTDCYLCGEPIDLSAPRWTKYSGWERGLHLDHVWDIALNGPDTLENIRPTHGLCNITKPPTDGTKEEGST